MEKILGLGNALVDVLASLESDKVLSDMELSKGCMTLIDDDKLLKIRKYFAHMNTHLATGGSAGNAIRTLACLGAGTGFIGKVARDAYGDFFRRSLSDRGTETHLLLSADRPTGVASTFISPDGERTFGTYLGAAATLTADELRADMFEGYAYLFIEGYLVQDHAMILRAIELAKQVGLQVCLDLASSNIVAADLDFFSTLVRDHVDIVFANEEEAKAFTGKEAEAALDHLAALCRIAVVKVGRRGAYVRRGTEMVHVDALEVPVVADTTGAGDYYAAGFLYGLVSGLSLRQCAQVGSILAGHVVGVIGTELPASTWAEITAAIHQL